MTTITAAARTTRRPQAGPPLLVPVIAYAVLTIAAVVANISTPHPDATAAAVLHYTQSHTTAIKVGSWLLFSSAVPLALVAAIIYRRLRALGITAPGSAIALVGGVLASTALSLSGMSMWVGGRLAADAPPSLARALADLSFLAGGPAFAVAFGMLLLGIAVPGLIVGLLPRPVAWAGLVLGAVGEISSLSLIGSGFEYLLPVARFLGLVWLVAAAVLLPVTRHGLARREA
ncbi:MAG: DUF4386 domain-containing protein [Marmoricola sp.]